MEKEQKNVRETDETNRMSKSSDADTQIRMFFGLPDPDHHGSATLSTKSNTGDDNSIYDHGDS
jgi:hypothetical protein